MYFSDLPIGTCHRGAHPRSAPRETCALFIKTGHPEGARCVRAGNIFAGRDRDRGTFWRVGDEGVGILSDPVEIVPLPGPYTVGKAYRLRDGTRVVYDGEDQGARRIDRVPHRFVAEATSTTFRTTYNQAGDGCHAFDKLPSPSDVVGEWVETVPAPRVHEFSAQTEPTVVRAGSLTGADAPRTLPRVSADDILAVMQKHGACWITNGGLIATAKRLLELNTGIVRGKHPHAQGQEFRVLCEPDRKHITLRDLLGLCKTPTFDQDETLLSPGDAGWLMLRMGTALMPESFRIPGPKFTPEEILRDLDEWENPKTETAPPKVRLRDLKPGDTFNVCETYPLGRLMLLDQTNPFLIHEPGHARCIWVGKAPNGSHGFVCTYPLDGEVFDVQHPKD